MSRNKQQLLRNFTSSTLSRSAIQMGPSPTVVDPRGGKKAERGDHWVDGSGKNFRNPWPSYQDRTFWSLASFVFKVRYGISTITPNLTNQNSLAGQPDAADPSTIPIVKPTFGTSAQSDKIKSTWLGHAAFLLELPSISKQAGSRGLTFLCDPVFSQRCSPVQFAGPPPRVTPPPAKVSELPELDVILISHNHYDHCDLPTLKDVYTKHSDRPPYLFIPLANSHTLKGTVPSDRVIEMDWWDERIIEVEGKGKAKVTCTPCQHFCARTPLDKNHALWSSWTIQGIDESGKTKGSIWFGGDTGYCATDKEDHKLDTSLPVCPAFKEIGKRLGPFDLALIPIGAYAPRFQMSPIHNAPIDAVRMFRDLNAKKAVGMHWGTWKMAFDPVTEPPTKLAEAREVMGISEDEFGVTALGETRTYDV